MADRINAKQVLAEVRENRAKLMGCARHRFAGSRTVRIGDRHQCINCGGIMGLVEVGWYLRGWTAHGGNPDDIWPGWDSRESGGIKHG